MNAVNFILPPPRDTEDENLAEMKRQGRIAIRLIVVLAVAIFGLAALVPIRGAVVGSGEIAVDSRVKTILHPTGGILEAVLVHEGQRVREGQPLIRLDTTVLGPSARNAILSRDQLLAQRGRLEAERDGRMSIFFPEELARSTDPEARDAMARERRQFQLTRSEQTGTLALLHQREVRYGEQVNSYEAQVAATRRQIELIQPELEGLRSLRERGLVTIGRLNQMERTAVELTANEASLGAQIAQAQALIAETREQILNVTQSSRVEAAQQLAVVLAQLNEQDTRSAQASDVLSRSTIIAPQAGVIDNLFFTTIGSAIPAGQPIVQIVPDKDVLIVNAKVSPADIDALSIGQEARVRFSVLDDELSPEIAGKLAFIAAERTDNPETGASFYRVRVEVAQDELRSLKLAGGIRPGIPAQVFLSTGSRSLLSYAMKPLIDQMRLAFL